MKFRLPENLGYWGLIPQGIAKSDYSPALTLLTRLGRRQEVPLPPSRSRPPRFPVKKMRRIDRRVHRVMAWIRAQSFTPTELEEFAAAAIVGWLEDNVDRKLEALERHASEGRVLVYEEAFEYSESQLRRQHNKRVAGGIARAANSPTSAMKSAIKGEWELWHTDRSTYRKPSDFRRAMMLQFPDIVDGTLKNWMTEWGRQKRNPASRMSSC